MANLNELKPTISLNPFARFCCTIGNLPSSYMASLTYEEQLLWFCDFLQNTVIPAVNNNAECVKELQELYVILKNYVDNYFENLDVQNEINNKIDEMVKNGEFLKLLTPYFSYYEEKQNQKIENIDNKVNLFEEVQNQKIENINNKVNSAVNGSPIVATSIDEMIDTSRIYVLSTNGHWYYYSNNEWNDGGVYQAEENPEVIDIRKDVFGVVHSSAGKSVRTQINNILSLLDTTSFEVGVNSNETPVGASSKSYRWAIPYKLNPHEFVTSLNISTMDTLDKNIIVETWKQINNQIIRTGEYNLIIPKSETGELEYKTIPFFYNSGNDYGYITFLNPDNARNTLIYTTTNVSTLKLNALYLPNNGTSIDVSEIKISNTAIVLASMTINKINKFNKVKIVDIQGKGDYKDIVKAINEANNGDTLIIFPGEYIVPNETFCDMRTKTLYLKGINKDDCIIKSYDGRYNYPTIWCSAGTIENLTILSEYKVGLSNEIGIENKGSYAIHCEDEYGKNKSLTIKNCYVKSDFSPAIGTGLRKDAKFTVQNCEIISNQDENRGELDYGALFFHDSVGEQGHSIVKIINNIMKSTRGTTLRISNSIGGNNTVECEFLFNTLYDKSKGYGSVDVINNAFETNFELLPTSRGNNNNNINYINE